MYNMDTFHLMLNPLFFNIEQKNQKPVLNIRETFPFLHNILKKKIGSSIDPDIHDILKFQAPGPPGPQFKW